MRIILILCTLVTHWNITDLNHFIMFFLWGIGRGNMLAEWQEMIEWKNTSYHEICNLNEYGNLKFWYKYCLQNSYFPESHSFLT